MNFVVYRLPKETKFRIFELDVPHTKEEGILYPSFVVTPFDGSLPILFYPVKKELDRIPYNFKSINRNIDGFNELKKNTYIDHIEKVIQKIHNKDLYKVVISRRFKVPVVKDLNKTFLELCDVYRDAFVFWLSTEEFGTWIGASPELLLHRKEDKVSTFSLAGTRPKDTLLPWDKKNLHEQKIVTRYITDVFARHGMTVKQKKTSTKNAGHIEHLLTEIEADISPDTDIITFLKDLAPTPALCGVPKHKAMKLINEIEGDRLLYGGYCGPITGNKDFNLYVILRCAFIGKNYTTIFAGGGITKDSIPEKEWEETEKKLAILLPFLNR